MVPTEVLLHWLSARPDLAVEGSASSELAELRGRLHGGIAGSKQQNAAEFRRYVAAMVTGEHFGTTPEITLYSEQRLVPEPLRNGVDELTFFAVKIPDDFAPVVLNGETQVAARGSH